jgi:hypothetical protein
LARHTKLVDRRIRTIRLSTVAVVWLCGLGAGFYGLLSASARYGCDAHDNGFACRNSGSVVGGLIVLTVIAVVAAVTVMTYDRPPRRVLTVGGIGIAVLVVCFAAAAWVLATA